MSPLDARRIYIVLGQCFEAVVYIANFSLFDVQPRHGVNRDCLRAQRNFMKFTHAARLIWRCCANNQQSEVVLDDPGSSPGGCFLFVVTLPFYVRGGNIDWRQLPCPTGSILERHAGDLV